jgi:serine protease
MRRSAWSLVLSAVAAAVLAGGSTPAQPLAAQQPASRRVTQSDLRVDRLTSIADAAAAGLTYVPGQVAVKFRRGTSVVGQARALRGVRSRPSPNRLRWVGDVAVLSDMSEPDPAVLARQLRLQREVEWAEPVYLRRRHAVPNDPSYASLQWNLNAIGMPAAWDIQPGAASGVTVAIVDSGVTTSDDTLILPTWTGAAIQEVSVPVAVNPDVSRDRLHPGFDFVFFSAGGPVVDFDGHGTHVAMTVGQEANNELFGAGLAYGATLMPLKACVGFWELQFVRSARGISGYHRFDDTGFCPSDAIAEAIRYAADNGADVINLSLGGPSASQVEREAITYAISRGAVVVAAVGNGFEEGNVVEYPAGFARDIQGLISVGAVGRTLERAWYSNTGSHVEVVAPGGDNRATGAGTTRVWQSTLRPGDSQPGFVVVPRFDRYEEIGLQGTSMAVPHVSGVAAMLIAQGVSNPAHVERVITRTARDLGSPGRDEEYGFGLVQARAALFGMGLAR